MPCHLTDFIQFQRNNLLSQDGHSSLLPPTYSISTEASVLNDQTSSVSYWEACHRTPLLKKTTKARADIAKILLQNTGENWRLNKQFEAWKY